MVVHKYQTLLLNVLLGYYHKVPSCLLFKVVVLFKYIPDFGVREIKVLVY